MASNKEAHDYHSKTCDPNPLHATPRMLWSGIESSAAIEAQGHRAISRDNRLVRGLVRPS